MINFEKVSYKNFFSVGNHFINIDLNRSTSTLISGSNGAGKSTVLESITYALFGKTLKKIRLNDIVNHINKKNMVVELDFTKNGKTYKIVRGDKPKKFEFYCDGVAYNQDASARDLQASVEYILGFDYKLFTQIIVLNKERYVPFMDLVTADRRKVIEDILDINVFSFANEIVKQDTREISNKLNDIEYERGKLNERKKGLERLIEQADNNIQEQKDNLMTEILDSEVTLAEMSISINESKKELAEFNIDEGKKKELEQYRRELEKIASQFEVEVKTADKNINFYQDNDSCPVCEQTLQDDIKQKELDKSNKRKQEINDASNELIVTLTDAMQEINRINELIEQRNSITQQINIKEREYQQFKSRVSQLQQRHDSIKPNTESSKHVQELDDVKETIKQYEEEYNTLHHKQQEYELLKKYLKDDSIKADIIREYIDFINKKVNEYLRSMDFYISVTLDEGFNDKIVSGQRDKVSYESLSSGQKLRLNIALYFALLEVGSIKNSVVSNILLLDEILEPLDAYGVEMFMKLCDEKLAHKNLFVITQRPEEFKDYFRSEIEFELTDSDFTIMK